MFASALISAILVFGGFSFGNEVHNHREGIGMLFE
jgi:hypothetical protein